MTTLRHPVGRSPRRAGTFLLSAVLAAVSCVACGAGDARTDTVAEPAADVAAVDDAARTSDTAAADAASPDTADAGPAGCESVPPVVLVDARLVIDPETGLLRDALGREVALRGVNAGGRSKFAPFLPFAIDPEADLETVAAAADDFFARLDAWGLNAVRLTISWEALEPAQGAIDERYLARYEALVTAAWAHGARVIVDMHQDLFASPFCGDGFPPWTVAHITTEPPRHDCPRWYLKYFGDEEVEAAFDDFWSDATGVRTAFRAIWTRVATRFADHPGVVGFEILNEPGPGSASDLDVWKRDVLGPFHTEMAALLRSSVPEILVFYDGSGQDAVSGQEGGFPRPEGEGLVFAPHLYDPGIYLGIGWNGVAPEPGLVGLSAFRAEHATPVLIGEFGVKPGVPGGEEWIDALMDLVDRERLSTTLWEYSDDDELWNDEDFSVIAPDGTARPVLLAYVRPWLRALAGSAPAFTWDAAAGHAEAGWTAGDGVTEVVLPALAFPEGPRDLAVTGDGVCYTWDDGRGELRVRAPAGTAVSLQFRR